MSKSQTDKTGKLRTAGLFLIPLLLLAGVIALFLQTGGGLEFTAPVPIEALTVERIIIHKQPVLQFELIVRNTSPEPVTIAQVVVNEGVRPFSMSPSTSIPRLGTAHVYIDYGWVQGEAYGITLFSTNAIPFNAEIPVAFETPQSSAGTLLGFTLIGLYVGVIPIFLGIFWLPALRQLGARWLAFLMAVTVGLLIFLGVDTLVEAVEQAAQVPGPFQGLGLIAIGSIGIFLLLAAISARQHSTGRSERARRLSVAYLVALGMGLHNLGEGLAIGAAYNVGEVALGTFLVVGFILQNITEGLGIIAPILQDKTRMRDLVLLGLLGGVPAILGTWLGGFSPSPTMAVFFLSIGAGAIFQVVHEIAKMLQKELEKRQEPILLFSGVMAGMLILWVTGLIVK